MIKVLIKIFSFLFLALLPVVSTMIPCLTLKYFSNYTSFIEGTVSDKNLKEISYDNGASDIDFSPFGSNTNVTEAVLFTLPDKQIKLRFVKIYITKSGKFEKSFIPIQPESFIKSAIFDQ